MIIIGKKRQLQEALQALRTGIAFFLVVSGGGFKDGKGVRRLRIIANHNKYSILPGMPGRSIIVTINIIPHREL